MRISLKEKKAIIAGFAEILAGYSYSLYLFGSRTNDKKKGGDIDLLLVVESISDKNTVVDLKSKIRSRIFDFIDEQKIDITVTTKDEIKSDVFLSSISPNCILLAQH